MAEIFVTRKIPEAGINIMKDAGHVVRVSQKDGVLTHEELCTALTETPYDAVVSLLTDTIDAAVFDAVPTAQIFANFAVGYNNIDLVAAAERGVTVTNTPGVLTDTVAEYALALMLAVGKRIPEADRFTRSGKYDGWAPELMLGNDLRGKTLGIVGAGRIGCGLARRARHGLGMHVLYSDVAQCADVEREADARFVDTLEELLKTADVVSLHVPLMDSTHHLITAERLALMKKDAYLINTSRGPVIDEAALVAALQGHTIAGAGLDVFEHEPQLTAGLAELPNVVLTPHIASASTETRSAMSEMVAHNICAFLRGDVPPNVVAAQ